MVTFTCFRDGKCEWDKGLQDFASQFNNRFSKDYSLSKCLDISDRTRMQPEVLLESSGNKPMVIECKKIVYPPDYYEKHRRLHEFYRFFSISYNQSLKPQLKEDTYEIWINQDDLYTIPNKRLSVSEISEQIVRHILDQLGTFTILDEISSDQPISWHFRRGERDNSYESGLRLNSLGKSGDTAFDTEKAEAEIEIQLVERLLNTKKKFQGYENCLKILILEICGDILSIPSLDTIVEIVNNANIPHNIDQIWLADPEDAEDEPENLITYHQIFVNSSSKQLRPFGLCAGEFTVPNDFDAPLPEDLLSAFEGK
jgi:hypothetical protein